MLKLKKENVILFLFIPFLLWSYLGGHKQIIFGVNSDHITIAIAFLGSIFSILIYKKLYTDSKKIILIFSLILIIQGISLFRSQNTELLYGLLVNIIYYIITLTCAYSLSKNIQNTSRKIITLSTISSIVVIVSLLTLGISSWGRITIPTFHDGAFGYYTDGYEGSSDTNVLAYFLHSGVIFSFWLWPYKSNALKLIIILIGLFAALLTFSRSSVISISLTIITTYLFFILSSKNKISAKTLAITTAFILTITTIIFTDNIIIDSIIYRINEGSASSNSDRLYRLRLYLEYFKSSSLVDILLGQGVASSRFTIDPHNFYISTLYDTGALSLILIILSITFPLKNLLHSKSNHIKLFSISITVYFLVCSLLYWQTRFYYHTLFLLYLLYFYQTLSMKNEK